MPIDLSRKRDPDSTLIKRMANQLVAIRQVKRNVDARDIRQRGWSEAEIARIGDRAVIRAKAIMDAKAATDATTTGQAA